MNPDTQGLTTQQKMEQLRQRALGSVPNAKMGDTSMAFSNNQPAVPSGGTMGAPTAQAQGQLKQEKGEARSLVDTLTQRLKALTKRGE